MLLRRSTRLTHSHFKIKFFDRHPLTSYNPVTASLLDTSSGHTSLSGAPLHIAMITLHCRFAALAPRLPLPPSAGGQLHLPSCNCRLSIHRSLLRLTHPLCPSLTSLSQPSADKPILPDAASSLFVEASPTLLVFMPPVGDLSADVVDLLCSPQPLPLSLADPASESVPLRPLFFSCSLVVLTITSRFLTVSPPLGLCLRLEVVACLRNSSMWFLSR